MNYLFTGTLETLYMVFTSLFLSYLIGIPFGILLTLTRENGIKQNRLFYQIFGSIINMARSLPFIILLVMVIPFTRVIVGTSIGTTAMIVPLTISAIPFVARMIESALLEVDKGIIETSLAFGASTFQIVLVYLKEAIPSLIRGLAITAIALIGYSAMAGTVGGGGLGDIAIRYGYERYEYQVLIYTVIILIILVEIIQNLFYTFAKLIDKKK